MTVFTEISGVQKQTSGVEGSSWWALRPVDQDCLVFVQARCGNSNWGKNSVLLFFEISVLITTLQYKLKQKLVSPFALVCNAVLEKYLGCALAFADWSHTKTTNFKI
ncbi:unnamed protein product [Clavelina lepadiformis]|uniref:Uncharacterized protein n=1 Tax=Clavelina lepadiformis TaxID=159417 RepID=A0ABP0FNV5_CLALP